MEVRAQVAPPDGAATVTLTFNDASYPLQSLGGGSYAVALPNMPHVGTNTFRLAALDATGNPTLLPANGVISLPAGLARDFGPHVFQAGDPSGFIGTGGNGVNTQNGNFTTSVTDLTVAGVGATALGVTRVYNALAAFGSGGGTVRYTETGGVLQQTTIAGPPHLFGRGWSSAYALRLLLVDNLVMQGAQVFYPDGRVVSFRRDGGSFAPLTPFSYDQLVAVAEGYELRHKDTLLVELFDAQGRLVGQRDRNDNRVTLTYTGDRLTSVANASGRVVTFDYSDDGYITAIHAPENKTLVYAYTDGDLTSVTDARGNTTAYAYNAQHQLTQVTTPEGYPSLRLGYDGQFRVAEQTVGASETYAFTYGADGSLITFSDANGSVTRHSYDALGRIVAAQDALGFTEQYGYDESFNRTSFTDRAGHAFAYSYAARGNRLTERGPLGWQRAWSYNAFDQVTRAEDALGRATSATYDERANLTQEANAAGSVKQQRYDSRGLLIQSADFNGNVTSHTYDPTTGDRLTTTDGAGTVVSFSYDGLGRLTSQTNGRGFTTTFTYDGNDHVVQIATPLGATQGFTFDKNNTRTATTDPNGGVTTKIYAASARLIEQRSPLGFVTRYDYDALGHVVRLEDAEGRVWTYDYDAVYNRIAEHGPEARHTLFAYNAARQVTAITQCNSALVNGDCAVKQVQQRVYDELGRVSSAVANYVPGAPVSADTNVTTNYTYDLVGNLLSLTDANGNAIQSDYDALNRLVRQTDAAQLVTTYAYDANDNLVAQTNPRGFTTSFSYDGANRLAATTDALTQTLRYAYDANGNLAAQTDQQGVVTRYSYDALDRLEALTQNERPGEPATSDQNVTTRFGYDLNGNLRFVYDPRGSYITEYQYDAANQRILTLDAAGGETRFAYDRVGNRTSITDANGQTTTVSFDGLNRRTGSTNAAGQQVTWAYDQLSNLLSVTNPLGAIRRSYDHLNRLTEELDALNRRTAFSYDAVGNRLTLTHPDGRVLTSHYTANTWLAAVTDAEGRTTTYTRDGMGNVVQQRNPNATVTEQTYDPIDQLLTLVNRQVTQADQDNDDTPNGPSIGIACVDGDNDEAQSILSSFTYSYDQVGQRVVVNEYEYEHEDGKTVTTAYSYDPLRRLVREQTSDRKWKIYSYDEVGNRLELRTGTHREGDATDAGSENLTSTTYSYGPLNELLTAVTSTPTDAVASRCHLDLTHLVWAVHHEIAAPHGHAITRDNTTRLLALADHLLADSERHGLTDSCAALQPEVVADAIAALRAEIVAQQHNGGFASLHQLAENLLSRLKLADTTNQQTTRIVATQIYTYDANGNRLSYERFEHEATELQGMAYTYDTANRLVQVQAYSTDEQGQRTDGGVTKLAYDGEGRRLIKTYEAAADHDAAHQTRVEYVFDGQRLIAAYRQVDGTSSYRNYYRGDQGRIVAQQSFEQDAEPVTLWYHYDGLGALRTLTQHDGVGAGFDTLSQRPLAELAEAQRPLAELAEARVRWLSLSKPASVG